MTLHIQRLQYDKSYKESFEVAHTHAMTLLSALYQIKSKLDPSLTFGAGCRSGVCGSCAVLVNDKETLACVHKVSDDDVVGPLRYHTALRDLKVDKSKAHQTLDKIHIPQSKSLDSSPDPKRVEKQSECILCDSCYSACPVLAVNPDFLGPFALTKAYRYLGEVDNLVSLERVQANGIWDCTLCGECTIACPQGIDPKMDITMLRSQSAKAGYGDPNYSEQNFGAMDFGTPDFGGGF